MKKICAVLCVIIAALFVLSGCGSSKESSQAQTSATAAEKAQDSGYDQTSPKDASWFNDAVFIGDSVTVMLDIYCENNPDALGDAKFICAGSLSYSNAQWDINAEGNVHPTYKGKQILAETAAEATGASKVFIMLGMNDIGIYGADGAVAECKKFAERMKTVSPNAKYYFQSVTPKMKSHEDEVIYNDLIKDFNTKLKKFCDDNGYKYLDIYSAVCDENGALPEKYCGDPEPEGQGIHFTNEACKIWVDYLKNNA
ncbi:MAG TPA: hypothetical protein DEO32_03895 [Ruminococcaceae bacterium]|nr:hypothetical protein [Oscillospiraceae bacterium]